MDTGQADIKATSPVQHYRTREKMGETHMDYTFEDYRSALEGAGPKLKELVLDRAAHDPQIDFSALKELVDFAYRDEA